MLQDLQHARVVDNRLDLHTGPGELPLKFLGGTLSLLLVPRYNFASFQILSFWGMIIPVRREGQAWSHVYIIPRTVLGNNTPYFLFQIPIFQQKSSHSIFLTVATLQHDWSMFKLSSGNASAAEKQNVKSENYSQMTVILCLCNVVPPLYRHHGYSLQ